MGSRHDEKVIRISEGTGNLGKVKNRHLKWRRIKDRFSDPIVTKESFKQYLGKSVEEQLALKNSGGYWIGAHCDDGRRALSAIHERDTITFDIDSAPEEIVDDLRMQITGISGYEFAVHSTRKHTRLKPRLRIAFPLLKPIPVDKYMPAARILASKLDPTMKVVDPVSFRPAQMMFWPSRSKDGEFLSFANNGELLDADALLEEFGDWQDLSKLPVSDDEDELRSVAKKAENPHTKKGIIGAFCRAYDVEAAIEKFLPGVYVPGDEHSGKPRYTYTGGSAANGAIIEDDGLFLYSYHGTDPCSDRLVNAFDLVRIHLFGDQDDPGKTDLTPGQQPSFKAMVEFLAGDEPTRRELAAERYDLAAMIDDSDIEGFDDDRDSADDDSDSEIEALLGSGSGVPVTVKKPTKPPKHESWFPGALELNEDGGIRATLPNVATIIQNDARTWSIAAYNEFTGQTVARRALVSKNKIIPTIPVADPTNGDLWSSAHDISIRAMIESENGRGKTGYGVKITDRDLQGGVMLAAAHNRFHPVRDYFDGLVWDGRARLDSLLIRYLGCPDTPYHRDVIRTVLVAAVTRVYEPGHKFDSALVLEGSQGVGKSTFIKVLARWQWFSELQGDMGDQQKMVEQMMGFLILELPELAGLRKSEVDDTKAFLSRTDDTVRLAYERRATVMKRQCIFIGSTNDKKYLKDQTGNRRFWPVKVAVGSIDLKALDAEMDQVWAEAVHVYRAMRTEQPLGALPLYLTDKRAVAEAQEIQEAARLTSQVDEWADEIAAWVDKPLPLSELMAQNGADEVFDDDPLVVRTAFTLKQVWEFGLAMDRRATNPGVTQTLDAAVARLEGWVKEGNNPVRRFGHQARWKVRVDCSPEERWLGYMLVTGEEGDLM